jgi:protein SCO1/2
MHLRLIIFAATTFIIGALGAIAVLNFSGRTAGPTLTQVQGEAQIGGPFTLTAHTGERVSEKDFQGQYKLIFFGFTNCPDVCPTELTVITNALDQLGKQQLEKVTPIFITVDPERDTVERMASYVSNFHERLVGLTGSPAEIADVAKAYRVYYSQVKDDSSAAGYTVDHSSNVYLMGPEGKYIDHFSFGTPAEEMAEGLTKHL